MIFQVKNHSCEQIRLYILKKISSLRFVGLDIFFGVLSTFSESV